MTTNGQSIQLFKSLPKLIVFDLDYTLWPLWVDTHVCPPLQKTEDGTVRDRLGTKITLYKDVISVLEAVTAEGIKLAAASRTGAIEIAENLLDILDLNKYFAAKEIYPGSKVAHFSKFKDNLGISYNNMLFFDDEERNIRDLSKIGVTAIHVPEGVSWNVFLHGLSEFSKKK